MGNFKYRKRDAAAVKERATQTGGAFDNYTDPKIPRYKIQEDNLIRIMPPPPDMDQEKWGQSWGIELWLHNNIGSDKSSYLCINKMKGKDCVLCDRIGDLTDEDLVGRLKAKKRILCYVIDRDDEKAGPQLLPMPWSLEKEISGRCIDKKTGEILYIDDPEDGFDVTFTREGKGLKTKYGGEEIARDSSPLCDNTKTQDKWLQFIQDNPLDGILNYYPADHLKKVFAGMKSRKDEAEDEDEDDKDNKPRRRGRDEEEEEKPARRRASRDEEEDEKPARRRPARDEPEEEDEKPTRNRRTREEEEEEEKPARRRASRDEEEEKPARRRAARDEPEEEEEEKPTRPHRGAKDKEEEEEEERPTSSRATSADRPRRRNGAASSAETDPTDEEEEKPARRLAAREDEEEDESAAGKRSLSRLRDRNR